MPPVRATDSDCPQNLAFSFTRALRCSGLRRAFSSSFDQKRAGELTHVDDRSRENSLENQENRTIDSAYICRFCEPGFRELFRQPRAEYEVQCRVRPTSDGMGHSPQLHAANDAQQQAQSRLRKIDDARPERRCWQDRHGPDASRIQSLTRPTRHF